MLSGSMRAGDFDSDAARAAAAVPDARDYLRWSRFPIVVVEPECDGTIVHFHDARYGGRRAGALGGISVPLDARLAPR
jgi:hypothetical protein